MGPTWLVINEMNESSAEKSYMQCYKIMVKSSVGILHTGTIQITFKSVHYCKILHVDEEGYSPCKATVSTRPYLIIL